MPLPKACLYCRAKNVRKEYERAASATQLNAFKHIVVKLNAALRDNAYYLNSKTCHNADNEDALFSDVRIMNSQAETETFIPPSKKQKQELKPWGTATGRFNTSTPNLQNSPSKTTAFENYIVHSLITSPFHRTK